MSREDYITHLAAGCCISVGHAQAATDDALASQRVRRRGWLSSDYRAGQMEHGEPDPRPEPCELPLTPRRPFWLERNTIERVEYSVEDLDYETRELWRTVNKGEPEATAPKSARKRREYESTRADIINAAQKLGKPRKAYRLFEDYRRALCDIAEVPSNQRGWSEDSVRNALKSPRAKGADYAESAES